MTIPSTLIRQHALVVDRGVSDESRDPRRIGLAAIGASIGYALAVLVPGSPPVRVVFGVVVIVLFVGASLLLPLPKWQESRERRHFARNVMVGEALVIALIATVLALAVR